MITSFIIRYFHLLVPAVSAASCPARAFLVQRFPKYPHKPIPGPRRWQWFQLDDSDRDVINHPMGLCFSQLYDLSKRGRAVSVLSGVLKKIPTQAVEPEWGEVCDACYLVAPILVTVPAEDASQMLLPSKAAELAPG